MRLPGAKRLMITQVPVSCETRSIFASTPSSHTAHGRLSVLRWAEMASGATVVMGAPVLLDTNRVEQVPFWPMPLAPAARTLIDQLESDGGLALWEMSPDDARALSAVMGAM